MVPENSPEDLEWLWVKVFIPSYLIVMLVEDTIYET